MDRPSIGVAAVGLTLVLLAGCGGPRTASDEPGGGGTAAPMEEASGSWERFRTEVGWYRPEGLFWIGDSLVGVAASTVWSWSREMGWEEISTVPQADECEGCGYSESAVWTGDELLLWGGGFSYRAPDGRAYPGASVDLGGNVAPLPDAPIPVRWWHDAVWTGDEMIVFGGGRDSHGRRDGAAYDPSTRRWRAIEDAPVGGYANTLVWTGTEMITWGGIEDSTTGAQGYPTGFLATGAAYDPVADEWRMLERSPLNPRGWHSAVWTGSEMIVWGGVAQPSNDCYDCGYAEDAGAYDPATGTWRRIDAGPLSGRVDHTAVWTGDAMIVWGGSFPGGGAGFGDGAVYDAARDGWTLLPDSPIEGRYRHAAIWNGEEMIVWGGQSSTGGSLRDGAIYRP